MTQIRNWINDLHDERNAGTNFQNLLLEVDALSVLYEQRGTVAPQDDKERAAVAHCYDFVQQLICVSAGDEKWAEYLAIFRGLADTLRRIYPELADRSDTSDAPQSQSDAPVAYDPEVSAEIQQLTQSLGENAPNLKTYNTRSTILMRRHSTI
jgi:hypothetical protein